MTRPLLLLAASGLAREAAVVARAIGDYEVIGFLDDNDSLWGTTFEGTSVLGGFDLLSTHADAHVVLCAGRGAARAAIAARLSAAGFDDARYATLVHPDATVSDESTVGAGTIVMAGAVLTTTVSVGRHVVLMPNVTLTHDNVLAECVTVAAGVSLGGWVHLGARSYVGMNASVRERVRLGEDVVVGMGAVVLRDVADGDTVIGNPARSMSVTTTGKRS